MKEEQRTGIPPDNATELPRLTSEQLAQTLSLAIVQAGGNRDTVKAAFRLVFDKSPELARLVSQTLANWEADKILQQ